MDEKKLDNLVDSVKNKLAEWLKKKPTGKFVIEININEGGIRGTPKIIITENM